MRSNPMSDSLHRTVVSRQTRKSEATMEISSNEPAISRQEDANENDKLVGHGLANRAQSVVPLLTRRNFWFIVWTVPILAVLFWLPMQEEFEIQKGFSRAKLEERVSVLAQYPVDFVVHATTPVRWYKTRPFKTSSSSVLSSSSIPCTRLFGFNETTNKNHTLRKSLPRIRHIRVIGERNTGTRTLVQDLTKALRNVSIDSGVTRWGYWFQDAALLNLAEFLPEETLVIHVVLDPYDWFARLQTNPIHAPYHRKGNDANWTSSSFFKRNWTIPRPEWDDPRPPQGHCQYRFPYGTVMPCLSGQKSGTKANKMYPVYEMHPTKLAPFPTVVHLRTAKLVNHLNVSTWMPHVVHVRSPDIAGLHGVNSLVSALLDRYRLSIACEVHKRDVKSPSSSSTSTEDYSWSEHPPEPLTSWQVKFITCNLDWDIERVFGFTPKEDLKTACPHGYVGHQRDQIATGAISQIQQEKSILFRFMDGITNLGRRRQRQRRRE